MVKRRPALVVLCGLLLTGCGSSAPTVAPTPPPPVAVPVVAPPVAPASVDITGRITDTMTGQPIGTFSQSVPRLPAAVTVAVPGYVTRQTVVTTAAPSVDLFPERGFDLGFYRQLARRTVDAGSPEALRVWSVPSSLAIAVRAGLPAGTAAALEAVARQTIPALTGGRLSVQSWAVVDTPSVDARVIDVELVREPTSNSCGRGELGGRRIWLNVDPSCAWRGHPVYVPLLGHELGHVLGFSHVTTADTLMSGTRIREEGPSALERHHAALAYARPRGNLDIDVDVDPSSSGTRGAALVVVD